MCLVLECPIQLVQRIFILRAFIRKKSYEKCRMKFITQFPGVWFLRNQACLKDEVAHSNFQNLF